MNTHYYQEWLSDEEVVRACESHADPLVRRLVSIILENGFDFDIPSDSYATTIDEYIDELKSDIRYAEEQREACENELTEATAKAHKLSLRTVPQLLQDMADTLKEMQETNRTLQRDIADATKREQDALHKMNMWAILNK